MVSKEDYNVYDVSDLKSILLNYGNEVQRALDENEDLIKSTAGKLRNYDKIILSGCGDKFITPLITQFLTDAYTSKNVRVMHSRILANYTPEWVDEETLIIFLTASGTTTDVVEAVKKCKECNAEMIVLTQLRDVKPNSVISKLEDYSKSQIIRVLKRGEVTWPATTTFHTFLAVLNSLFIHMMMDEGKPVDALLSTQLLDVHEYMNALNKSEEFHDWCFETAKHLKELNAEGFYFLGDGPRYAAARKGALVHFVESCKEDAFPVKSEEFVHLVIETLAEKNEVKNVLVLLKPRNTYVSAQAMNRFEEIKSLWSEKAGKDKVIIIDPFQFLKPKGVGKKNDILLTHLHVLALEWLSYYYAIINKMDPMSKQVSY